MQKNDTNMHVQWNGNEKIYRSQRKYAPIVTTFLNVVCRVAKDNELDLFQSYVAFHDTERNV